MNKVALQIKVKYNDMGRAEKKIADWILNHEGEILPLSISELADNCMCGEATIVRFARRLGFSGYQELKISIAREIGKRTINKNITESDNCIDIYEKIISDIYCSLELTAKSIDKKSFDEAADVLSNADNIAIFGLGNSAPIALDAAHKLSRAGLNANAYSDNHMQAIIASHLKPGDAAIGISHSGSSKDIIEALRIARENGAATISVTNIGKSPIKKQSDIILNTASSETEYTILGLNSRIAALAIVDTLYCYIVVRGGDKTQQAIEKTESALKDKKY